MTNVAIPNSNKNHAGEEQCVTCVLFYFIYLFIRKKLHSSEMKKSTIQYIFTEHLLFKNKRLNQVL